MGILNYKMLQLLHGHCHGFDFLQETVPCPSHLFATIRSQTLDALGSSTLGVLLFLVSFDFVHSVGEIICAAIAYR